MSIPDERREAVVGVLRDRQFGYTVADGTGDQSDRSIVTFLAPADAVEHVLDEIEEAGVDRHQFTASLDAEFAHFEDVDEVQNRWEASPNRLAPAALRSKAKDLRQNARSYVWMMVLSAVVATAGLFMGSPAVVVGSMVIAPIVSPVLTASVGLVRDDRDMFVRSVHMQAYGLGIAVGASALVAWTAMQLSVVPSALAVEQMELVRLRVSPSILALLVGLTAGAAGAYGLATKGQVTIVGVMIAAALIPTAAAVGVGAAWGDPVLTLGALLLLLVSMIGVNVGGTLMLLYLEYRPDHVDEGILSFDDARRAAVVVGTIALAVATVTATGGLFYQQSSFERSTNAAISEVVDDEAYADLGVEEVTVEYTAPSVSDRTTVTVTLARTSGEDHPELPGRLEAAIDDRTDREPVVRVRYVDYERSGGEVEPRVGAP